MKTWDEFKRYQRWDANALDFYGCVDKDGVWFDSSDSFSIAVHWCCYEAGAFEVEDEIYWMNNTGRALGYSVIHGTMLKQMYEKGLIK